MRSTGRRHFASVAIWRCSKSSLYLLQIFGVLAQTIVVLFVEGNDSCVQFAIPATLIRNAMLYSGKSVCVLQIRVILCFHFNEFPAIASI